MTSILTFLLRLYKWTVSPFLHFVCGPACGCRFEPTCSVYAIEAIEVHGPGRGSWLAVKRIFRCHPWGGLGFDPVPAKDSRISNFDSRLNLSPQRSQRLNADAAFPHSRIAATNEVRLGPQNQKSKI